ncbi:FGGY-family carbohydrate kinase [Actinomyces wuliandei]|uniref:FGGY-family carbohydrate kinase n=1 Tax=Actinomyces wuliandei TaxID=2057743 RepID=UPI0011190C24|nr:FGGY-family carbohydrate kinase [Actinomyces wuliandei]
MSTPYILALDEGTTNAKALAVARDGTVLAAGSAPVPVAYPRPGWVEQDADAVWKAQVEAIRACLGGLDAAPEGVAISNQRESVVAWDARTGAALGPVIGWQDSRTAEFCDWLRSPERELAVSVATGLSLDPMFSAPKMRYLLDRLGASAGAVDGQVRVGTVDSWLVSRLTGQDSYVIEAGNASRTLLLDLSTLEWSQPMCDLFGVAREILPQVVASNADFGSTRGLEVLPDGVPVVGVLGDSHAALFGHGCRTSAEGKATYGTGSSVMVPAGAQPSVRRGVSTTLAWLTEEPVYGHEGNIVASGTAMDWTARLLGVEAGRGLDALAATVEDAAGVSLVPAFTGLGAPWWDRQAVGVITGVTAGSSRGHLARAALESVAHQVADVVDALGAQDLTVLHADGGATASCLLMQTQADLLGRDVMVSADAEISALGAALMGFTRLGWEVPTPLPGQQEQGGRRYHPVLDEHQRSCARTRWSHALARSRLAPGS